MSLTYVVLLIAFSGNIMIVIAMLFPNIRDEKRRGDKCKISVEKGHEIIITGDRHPVNVKVSGIDEFELTDGRRTLKGTEFQTGLFITEGQFSIPGTWVSTNTVTIEVESILGFDLTVKATKFSKWAGTIATIFVLTAFDTMAYWLIALQHN